MTNKKISQKLFRHFSLFTCLILLLTQTFLPVSAEQAETEATDETVTVVREEESLRGLYEKHYLCSDGTYLAVSYPEAIHYLDSDGETWLDIDNTLTYQASTGSYRTADNGEWQISLPADGSSALSDGMFSIGAPDGAAILAEPVALPTELSLQLSAYAGGKAVNGARSVTRATVETKDDVDPIGKEISDADSFALPKVSDSITYEGLLGNGTADVQYILSANKIKENVILHEGSTIDTLTYTIPSGELTAAVQEDGSVLLTGASGEVKYTITAPFLYDAADEYCYAVEVSAAVQTDGSTVITYAIDQDWLFSDERVYPIVFDPITTTGDYSASYDDTYVKQGSTTNFSGYPELLVGNQYDVQHITYFMFYNLPRTHSIRGSLTIVSAKISLQLRTAPSSSTTFAIYNAYNGWSPSTLTYANQPTLPSTPAATVTVSSGTYKVNFDVTSNAQSYYASGNESLSYAIKTTTNVTNKYYNFYSSEYGGNTVPVVTVNYSYKPLLYRIKNEGTGKYLTIYQGRCVTNQNACVAPDEETASKNYMGQGFRLVPISVETNTYQIIPLCHLAGSGSALTVSSSGLNVVNTCKSTATFQFQEISTGSGKYTLYYTYNGTTYALTANDGDDPYGTESTSTTAASNVYLATTSSSALAAYQTWTLEYYDPHNETYYQNISLGHPFGKSYSNATPINSDYGRRSAGDHIGVDFGDPYSSTGADTPLYAPFEGTVVAIGTNDEEARGYYIVIKADTLVTPTGSPIHVIYQHLKEIPSLSKGSKVDMDTPIALMGNTGTSTGKHLHMEVMTSYSSLSNYTAIDPMIFYRDIKITCCVDA